MKCKSIVTNIIITVVIFCIAIVLSIVFQNLKVDEHVSTVFVFAVFLISLITDGYVYGILSAVCAVLAINYAFTYPYFALNFSIPVNLISAIVMMAVSILTSMLITKIKYYENMKAESEAERIRANLLRAVSHDIRTPLTTIYGASSTLRAKKEKLTTEQQDMLLKNIEADSEWLIQMVENLLSITRINTDKIDIKKTSVVLDELVDAVIEKFRNRHPDLRMEIDIPDEIIFISMDPILIEQVIMNLLENTVMHAKNMTLITFRVYTMNHRVVFEVEDDGCGIRKDRLKKLFTGTYAIETPIADSKKKNAGIGLTVCATIIKAHGGEISAENRKGGGALFRFTLDKEDGIDNE